MTQSDIESLKLVYIETASDLHSAQAGLINFADELHAFIEARDTLREHPEFSGKLPQTYYSGGDLDPDGDPDGSDEADPSGGCPLDPRP